MKLNRTPTAVITVATTTVFLSIGASAVASPAAPSPRQAAEPGLAPVSAKGTYLDRHGHALSMEANAATNSTAALGCTPGNGADYPHYSAPDVAGHATYIKGTCRNNTAKVYNCLYEWYTDSTWRQKACSGTKTVYAGGGSANRTVARRACDSTSRNISWRNHEDVDVIGEIDTADKPFRQANVYCVVN
jgi:hypothetical protein